MILSIILLAHPCTTETQKPFSISTFTEKPGIHFEEIGTVNVISNEWNIYVYYNLTNYWEELTGFNQYIETLKYTCEATRIIELCDVVLEQFNNQLQEIEHKNQLLYKSNNLVRQKRSPFDIIGTIDNRLFGVLDQDDAEKIATHIEQVKNNEDHLLKLLKNQTSIIETTTNVIKKSEEAIDNQFRVINKQIYNLQKNVTELSVATLHVMMLMVNYQSIQTSLIQLVIDSNHGRINPNLITPDQLKQQISIIRDTIHDSFSIPGVGGDSQNLVQLYKIITVETAVRTDKIIFHLKVPLVNKELYQLFSVIPVPTHFNNSYIWIQPTHKYLAVTLKRDQHFSLEESDVSKCLIIEINKYLCHQHGPIQNAKSEISKCELSLLNHEHQLSNNCVIQTGSPKNTWISLHQSNNWIFILKQSSIVDIICNDQIYNVHLPTEGSIRMEPGCTLKQATMTITSGTLFNTSFTSSFTPYRNLSHTVSETAMSKYSDTMSKSIEDNIDLNMIINAINLQKANEQFVPAIDSHNIHHYVMTHVSLYILIALILVVVVMYKRLSNAKSISNQHSPQPENINIPLGEFEV